MTTIRIALIILLNYYLTSACLAQSPKSEAEGYHKQAVRSFKNKDYKMADSLFTVSLALEKHPDTYYSRAICRNYMGNQCGYCVDLNAAAQMGDMEAKKQMQKDCVTKDSLLVAVETVQKELTSKQLKKVIERTECLSFNQLLIYNDSNRVILAYEYEDGGDTLYFNCEQIPTYVGGTSAMYSYISRNIQYPASARINGISGKVYIQFKVLSSGLAQEYEILKGVKNCFDCDMEAVRVIRSIGHWNPAKHQGRAVNFRIIIPISFRIQ